MDWLNFQKMYLESPEYAQVNNPKEYVFKYEPKEIVSTGTKLLVGNALNDMEKYDVMELVCIAAIETKQMKVALRYLTLLEDTFPASQRVALIKGLVLESETKCESKNIRDLSIQSRLKSNANLPIT